MIQINEYIQYEEKPNYKKIVIVNICPFLIFANYISDIKIVDIPIRLCLKDSNSLSNANILKQEIIIFSKDKFKFYIVKGLNELKISENKICKNYIEEIVLEIKGDDFTITKLIHDFNFSTKDCKKFPNDDSLDFFKLDKKEALKVLLELFDNIENYIEENELKEALKSNMDRVKQSMLNLNQLEKCRKK